FARKRSNAIFRRLVYRMAGAYLVLVMFASVASPLMHKAWEATGNPSSGEPFSLVSGISAWPTAFMRLIALALALCFLLDSYSSLRIGVFEIARRFRMSIADNSPKWFLLFT